jgi:2Fe-2S ferredoxin
MLTAIVIDTSGAAHTLHGKAGDSVMQLARAADLPVVGECNGSLACATCHMVVDPDWAARLAPVGEDEEAMLDTIFNLKPTSRLSCQIRLSPELDGIRLFLPA